jgi:hypothetical protein
VPVKNIRSLLASTYESKLFGGFRG